MREASGWERGGVHGGARALRATVRTVAALVSAVVLAVSGYAWASYHDLISGMIKSGALDGPGSLNGDQNILIMGLDSRLDENGNPLPKAIYDQLHAGDDSEGGYNTNVLMLIHVPADGSKAVGISIPRDDYVDLPGKPDGVSKEKIKQAYGLAKDQKVRELMNKGVSDKAQLEQQSREAGRKAEIATVQQFLGGVPIDHFVEVTLIGFYDVAKAVEPITVCLNEDTADTFSGANFHKGYQQVNASQALSFVRQRRDTKYKNVFLTDLDRERRQQAFIASVGFQLKQAGTFADPGKLQGLIDAGKKDVVVDDKLDPLQFAQQAQNLTGGNITFNTLPIKGYENLPGAGDVNLVDVPTVQAKVRELLGGPNPTSAAAPPTSTGPTVPPGTTLDVENATSRAGLAADVEQFASGQGFTQGNTSTDKKKLSTSTIYYGGSADAANALSGMLGGIQVQRDSSLGSDKVRLVIGSDFKLPAAASDSGSGSSAGSSSAPATTGAAGPATGTGGPDGAQPQVQGGAVPCVN